jgi:hypothetical protein
MQRLGLFLFLKKILVFHRIIMPIANIVPSLRDENESEIDEMGVAIFIFIFVCGRG